MNVNYRHSGLAVPGGQGLGQLRYPGDMVLDPVCGSGTTAAAALRLGRRFIVIDRNPDAIAITWARLLKQQAAGDYQWLMGRHGRRPAVRRHRWSIFTGVPDWDNGDSWVVQGDALAVMRSMPDSFVSLVYMDPPYGTQKEFQGKDGTGFSDVWQWDAAAEERLADLVSLPDDMTAMGSQYVVDLILLVKRMDPGMAAYLSWVALLAIECRRVMGETVWETVQKYPIIGEQVGGGGTGASRRQLGAGRKGL